MSVFDFFRKDKNSGENKGSDLLKPKICVEVVNVEILGEIERIHWSHFGTAYGNAKDTVPYYLKNIFCIDEKTALDAAHQLWCSICHQGVNMANAALPAYEILKKALLNLSDSIKVEILDIFAGFALCTSQEYNTVPNQLLDWEKEIQSKLLRDRSIFEAFKASDDKEIASMAKTLCDYLNNQKQ